MLLNIEDIIVGTRTRVGGSLRALDRVSLAVESGQAHGIVGDSGSGKTVMAYSILQILTGSWCVSRGSVSWMGQSMMHLPEHEVR